MSLKNRYQQLLTFREIYRLRAIDCAKLSIPTMFTLQAETQGVRFPTPWQSMGARCVNNLAAKLLLTLFPPNAPFFQLAIDDFQIQKMTGQAGLRAQVDEALNKMERAVATEIETSCTRPALFEALKQLIVGGNTLLVVAPNNRIRVYKLSHFVCKRDPAGNPLEIVTKEAISPLELGDELRAALNIASGNGPPKPDDSLDLYTGWRLVQMGGSAIWKVHQEINDQVLPNSNGSYPKDKCPALPLRWNSLDNEDYGRGIFEEYLGDFKSLEGLQKAIVQGAAAAAKILFLVKPNSTTKKSTITESESGDVMSGNAEDVTVLQMNKYNDFKVALDTRNEIIKALSFAFMLNTAVQRDGERVTAEEIRYMAQELESSLGGVYSTLSADLQLPLVEVLMGNMQRAGRLPTLPKGTVKPMITTGVAAIGRGSDSARLDSFLQKIEPLGPTALAYLNMGDMIKRVGTGEGIDMDGLVKPDQQVQQEQQQQAMQEAATKAAPNIVNKGAEMMQAQQGAPANG